MLNLTGGKKRRRRLHKFKVGGANGYGALYNEKEQWNKEKGRSLKSVDSTRIFSITLSCRT